MLNPSLLTNKNLKKNYIKTSNFLIFSLRPKHLNAPPPLFPLDYRDCPQRHPGRADSGGTNAIIEGPPQVDRENRPKGKQKRNKKGIPKYLSSICFALFFCSSRINKGSVVLILFFSFEVGKAHDTLVLHARSGRNRSSFV